MAGAKSPSTLPPFADNWVGGNIHGLSALAGTLYGYAPEITDVATALDKKVSQLVSDAGWKGDAAASFTKAWEKDSITGTALAVAVGATGDIVDRLALNLARIENALEQAADTARAKAVPIGPDGKPPQICLSDPVAEQWRVSYQSFWQHCTDTARQARVQAAGDLQKMYSDIGPDQGATPADGNTLADYLRGLWAIPSAYRKYLEDKVVPKLTAKFRAAQAARKTALAERSSPDDAAWKQAQQDFHDANAEWRNAKNDLGAAKQSEGKLSGLLDTRLSGLPGLSGLNEGLTGTDFLSKAAKFGLDLPVIDVAAAGLGTYFAAKDDIAAGQPWYEAVPEEASANVGGIAAGAFVGGLAADGAVAGLGLVGVTAGAGVVGVAAGAVVGGAVAIGVGDFAHNLWHESWGADIQQHGVAMGIADGIGDSAVKTGQDLGNMAKDIWHGVSSIF